MIFMREIMEVNSNLSHAWSWRHLKFLFFLLVFEILTIFPAGVVQPNDGSDALHEPRPSRSL
jgi:hypothetical protein